MRPKLTLKLCLALGGAVLGVTMGSLLRATPAPAQGSAPDGAPPGMIAYFGQGNGCPTGWAVAETAEGRIALGTNVGALAGTAVGTPLGDREDRKHTHSYGVQISLSSNNIAGAGGSNTQAAANGTYGASLATSPAPSGLPFVQYRGCVRQ
jgi:hypothetical protein